MILSGAILVLAAAMLCFYLQMTAERMLELECGRKSFETVVREFHLEFPRLLGAHRGETMLASAVDARESLLGDYFVLDYLLAHVARHHYTAGERLLRLKFDLGIFTLRLRRGLGNSDQLAATRKLATILRFFANIAGEQLPVGAALR